MDFLDWCSFVLKKLIEAGRTPHLDEIRLAQILYGEEFRTAGDFHHSTHRRGMLDAIKELVNLGFVEERAGRFWTVTPQGREFDANPTPLLRQMRSLTLETDEKRILRIVNALSPKAGSDPPHAWLEWVKRDPLLAEFGIAAGFDMQEVLWPVSEDLNRRGLVYRKALPGWHLDLKPTYRGLVWERRSTQVSEPEIGHVLFLDIVGYSKLPMGQQTETLEQLNEIVRDTDEYRRASSEETSLIKLPTGDGMALVFFDSFTAHVRCAIELGRALKHCPDLKLRMGLHSGPVYRVSDINDSRNVAGGGINVAQRVMDCGDAGHILLSKAAADNLQQLGGWEGNIQDLGEVEVKHAVKVHVYNLVDGELGNPIIPVKIAAQKDAERREPTPPAVDQGNGREINQSARDLKASTQQNRPDAMQMRLHDLSDNISKDYALLKEYEDELRLEDDPRRRARHKREIDRLKASASAYEREYKELEQQLARRPDEATHSERSELQQIHVKLDALLVGQSNINLDLYNLRQAILSRYDAGEQHIINRITERLDQAQTETVQTMLEALEKNLMNETEMTEAISAIQQALAEMKQMGVALPAHAELEETISAPRFDVKHKMKFSIPIVPLLLEYEGEVEFGSGVNLESVWNRLTDKFRRK
jgi:class 3 adenylate cyclase